MSQFFYIHPDNPQQRLINQAVEIVRKGGVIVYPTDSGYALGCKIEDKNAMERICRIRAALATGTRRVDRGSAFPVHTCSVGQRL